MAFWTQVLIDGLLLGGIYALSALSFSLIWGVMNIINLAHGSVIMLGAYVTWVLFMRWHLDPLLALPLVFALFFLAGYAAQWVLINRVIRASVFITLLLTFGLDLILANAARLIWTGDYRQVTTSYSGAGLHPGGVSIPYTRLGSLVVVLLLTFALQRFMTRTKIGRAIGATAQDLDAARMMGAPIPVVYALTMAIGIGLAGVAGTMVAVTFPFNPGIGGDFTLKSFVVAILGGLGNMYGPLIGGLVLGVVETMGAILLGPGYVDAISFVVLVLILVLRPTGIAGRAEVR